MRDDFAVFILTHGRADECSTYEMIRKSRYTGKLIFLLDDEDETLERYQELYGAENIYVFCKQDVFDAIDTMDTTGEHRAILFARHAVFDAAKELGLRYFLMLDDDYTGIYFRDARDWQLKAFRCEDYDSLFEAMIEFLEASNADTICFAQAGDFIGGVENPRFHKGLIRKAMNSFFCRTDRPIDFRGTMNEDVTTYTTLGSRGHLMFTVTRASVVQQKTQSLKGGMSDVYAGGTYSKAFYSVMSMPSAIKVGQIGTTHQRVHHVIDWKYCVPEILSERWKK